MKKIFILCVLLLVGMMLAIPASASDGSSLADSVPFRVAIAIILGILLALGVVFLMKRSMSTVRYQKRADGYVNDGSFSLTDARDIYLYSTVSRTRINNDNNRR
jgi:Ca2+/H+ antiporter